MSYGYDQDMLMTSDLELVAAARGLAYGAHVGQVDKAGKPYILHPEAVAASLVPPWQKALAWVHDVVEDTEVTLQMLTKMGFPQAFVSEVDALTYRGGKVETREAYYRRIMFYPQAKAVKIADVLHNSSPDRLAVLSHDEQERLRRKYNNALTFFKVGAQV